MSNPASTTTAIQPFHDLQQEVAALVAPALNLAVTDAATAASATKARAQIKEILDRIEGRRDELVRPFNTRVKAINEEAKKVKLPLEQANEYCRRQLGDFHLAEKRRQDEEARIAREKKAEEDRLAREKLNAQLKTATTPAQVMGAIEQNAQESKVRAQSFRQELKAVTAPVLKGGMVVQKFEVIDAGQVPREYCAPVDALIRKAIAAGARDIPGVRIWEEGDVRTGQHTKVDDQALMTSMFGKR